MDFHAGHTAAYYFIYPFNVCYHAYPQKTGSEEKKKVGK
jgi:hypothetical protein